MDKRQRAAVIHAIEVNKQAAELCQQAAKAMDQTGERIVPMVGHYFRFAIDPKYVSIYPKGSGRRLEITKELRSQLVYADGAFLPRLDKADPDRSGQLLFAPLTPYPKGRREVFKTPLITNRLIVGLAATAITQQLEEIPAYLAREQVELNEPMVFDSRLYAKQ